MKIYKIFFLILLLFAPRGLHAGDTPLNAHRNRSGQGWECDYGYSRKGEECEKIVVPENAHLWPEVLLTDKSSKWTCDKGYYKVGDRCEKVIVPQNASLDKSGHGWECNYKFKKVNDACVPMTKEEIKEQNELILKTKHKRKIHKTQWVSAENCKTEIKTNAEVCVKVTRSDLECKKNIAENYYSDCGLDLSYEIKTNYQGDSSLKVKVEFTVKVENKGGFTYRTQFSKDKSHILDAYESERGTMTFNFSFLRSNEITSVVVNSVNCEIARIDLY